MSEERLQRIEDKLDDHLEISTKNEVRIKFLGIGLGTVFLMIGAFIKDKLGM